RRHHARIVAWTQFDRHGQVTGRDLVGNRGGLRRFATHLGQYASGDHDAGQHQHRKGCGGHAGHDVPRSFCIPARGNDDVIGDIRIQGDQLAECFFGGRE
ncbi:conserved hypothetical protein, partial [Ricinus communis]